jgi:hypothetical protein
MIDGLVDIENIQNEQLLNTNYENTTIRMNIFPRPPNQEDYDYPYRYTANCVPLTKVNQFTENGIIHNNFRSLRIKLKPLFCLTISFRLITVAKPPSSEIFFLTHDMLSQSI